MIGWAHGKPHRILQVVRPQATPQAGQGRLVCQLRRTPPSQRLSDLPDLHHAQLRPATQTPRGNGACMTFEKHDLPDGSVQCTFTIQGDKETNTTMNSVVLAAIAQGMSSPKISEKLYALSLFARVVEAAE